MVSCALIDSSNLLSHSAFEVWGFNTIRTARGI
jgi:hypothetical protein